VRLTAAERLTEERQRGTAHGGDYGDQVAIAGLVALGAELGPDREDQAPLALDATTIAQAVRWRSCGGLPWR
jgi:hypothetical protein